MSATAAMSHQDRAGGTASLEVELGVGLALFVVTQGLAGSTAWRGRGV
ncbi:hypothetical protein DB30_06306 [Enhygromyxa salina]|uniref:Uncharacterized protein n=1 Tax=Enhygromyxa salina TaxID=215803 RepID=A0A0C2D428_9BACT|nr:hypothetical protein [Enhygromyxa salina]KIG14852.1 hypothetical protein DB30_06306 [Enhygromyxa salina]